MSEKDKEKKYVETDVKYEELLKRYKNSCIYHKLIKPKMKISLQEFIKNKRDKVMRVAASKEKEYEPLLADSDNSRLPDDSEVITLLEDEKIKIDYLQTETAKKIMDKYKKREREHSITISIDRTLSKLKKVTENLPSKIVELVDILTGTDTLGELYAFGDFLIDLLEKYVSDCQEFESKPNVVIYYPGDMSNRNSSKYDPGLSKFFFRKGVYRRCLGCKTLRSCSKLEKLNKSTRYLQGIKEEVEEFGVDLREKIDDSEFRLLSEEEIMSEKNEKQITELSGYSDKVQELIYMLENPTEQPPKSGGSLGKKDKYSTPVIKSKLEGLTLGAEIPGLKFVYEIVLEKCPSLEPDKISQKLYDNIKGLVSTYDKLKSLEEAMDGRYYFSPKFIKKFKKLAELIKNNSLTRVPDVIGESKQPFTEEILDEKQGRSLSMEDIGSFRYRKSKSTDS